MLGPSGSALIRVGARFPPCMKTVPSVPVTLQMPCESSSTSPTWPISPPWRLQGLNDTANPPDQLCTIEDLCGHGGFNGKEPNQWWRRVYTLLRRSAFNRHL